MIDNIANGAPTDFRVRTAEERRARMRARLISALHDIYLPDERGNAAVIDDVIRKAGVSRGTFYKYFDSIDEAVTELGRAMANDMLMTYQRLFGNVADPAIAVTAGTVLTLSRAALEPRWAAFTSRVALVAYFAQRDPVLEIVTHSLQRARDSELLHFETLSVAADLVIGVTIEGVRRAAHGETLSRRYINEIALMSLRGLGMNPDGAHAAIEEVWRQLLQEAPRIPWWKSEALQH